MSESTQYWLARLLIAVVILGVIAWAGRSLVALQSQMMANKPAAIPAWKWLIMAALSAAREKIKSWYLDQYGGERVFQSAIGNWPVVKKTGDVSYRISARYLEPGKTDLADIRAVWAGGFIFVELVFGQVPFLYAAIIGAVSIYPLRVLTRKLMRRHLNILITGGLMVWRPPGRKANIISGTSSFEVAVEAHSRARAEAMANTRRKDPYNPIYQMASEVTLRTGAGNQMRYVLMEIDGDINGELGHYMAVAIPFVVKASIEDANRRQAGVQTDDDF